MRYLLAPSTTYYWQVIATTRCGQEPGAIWSFTTEPPSRTVTAWRSMRTHGTAGELAIQLDPAAVGSAAVSEPRQGGIQKIEIDFFAVVSVTGTIEAEDLMNGSIISASGQTLVNHGDGTSTLVVEFAGGLPDEGCYWINVAGNIPELIGDTDCLVRGLVGDANGDGSTNLIDMAVVKTRNGSDPSDPGMVRYDVNLDGQINLIDMAAVKALNGNSVTCP